MSFNRSIFINCPFTEDYKKYFYACVFTIIRSGFEPRCALEEVNAAENRFEKICRIVNECDFGIHDISNTELDKTNNLPRFNMPLELGLFLGARRFGDKLQKNKKCLIFDRQPYRFQKFISDIAGQDIHSHDSSVKKMIENISSWLRGQPKVKSVPGGDAIYRDFRKFQKKLPEICHKLKLKPKELTFLDIRPIMVDFALNL